MKVVTLLENTACAPELAADHGLSLYIETAAHKILFDMGPDEAFLSNAEKLGVDLTAVELAILSHGHYDHGGGLRAFCDLNRQAAVLVHNEAFGEFYAVAPGEEPRYIGLDPELWLLERRIVPTADELAYEELTLFSDVPDGFAALSASATLKEQTADGFVPDPFLHEQDLLIQEDGKAVLFAGCAHQGIVNILSAAKKRLGQMPDVVFGGFHLFQLDPADPQSDELIAATGKALLEGDTVYYTGHCTGDYAYEKLHAILGDRLRHMSGGSTVEI